MAHKVEIEFVKTYATEANADKAVAKFFGEVKDLRYMIVPVIKDGKTRYSPLFVGMQSLHYGVQFHFNCVA